MTTQEQQEFRVVVRWLKVALGTVVLGAFGLGMWVARLQATAAEVPMLRMDVQALQRTDATFRESIADLVLLQCAQPGLNDTERAICAKYESRMPR